MAKAGDVRNHRIRHSASGTNPRMGLLRVRCRTALNCWAHGFNEQIFGADEQVRGRGQPPRLRPGCSRLVPSCGLGNRWLKRRLQIAPEDQAIFCRSRTASLSQSSLVQSAFFGQGQRGLVHLRQRFVY